MKFDVTGKVAYGRAFSMNVHCEAWWEDDDGGVISRRVINYRATFTPCPRGGRAVKPC
jgi:hypothetical protein